jgi:hypothetical protein
MVKTELVVPSEVGVRLEGMSVREGKTELISGVGPEDWDGSSEPPLAIWVPTIADWTAEGAVMRSVEVSDVLDAENSEAVSWVDELIPDTVEDGSSSTKDEEVEDAVVIRVEISEDSDGLTEPGAVGARSPSWDDGEGVGDVLDTSEVPAEGDSVALGASSRFEDEGSRIADSKVEDGSAEIGVEVPSNWAADVAKERSELDTSVKEAVLLGVVVSLAPVVGPIDTVGWADSEAGKTPSSPSPSTNTMQNLWLGSSTRTKHFCSITPTDLLSVKPRGGRTFHLRSFLRIPLGQLLPLEDLALERRLRPALEGIGLGWKETCSTCEVMRWVSIGEDHADPEMAKSQRW